jgi:hypothetical protein
MSDDAFTQYRTLAVFLRKVSRRFFGTGVQSSSVSFARGLRGRCASGWSPGTRSVNCGPVRSSASLSRETRDRQEHALPAAKGLGNQTRIGVGRFFFRSRYRANSSPPHSSRIPSRISCGSSVLSCSSASCTDLSQITRSENLAICSASRLSRRATSDILCCSLVLAICVSPRIVMFQQKTSDVSRTVFHRSSDKTCRCESI